MDFKPSLIISRVPLRVSLAGGGTDLPSFYQKEGGAVCSFTINKYVYVIVKDLPEVFPYKYKISYSQTELSNDHSTLRHPIIRECLWLARNRSLDFATMADMPAGTGMGSSSAFTVACLQALHLKEGVFLDKEELARRACTIEIYRLGEPIGRQDQYAAAYGGLNFFQFQKNGEVNTQPVILDIPRQDLFFGSLSLFYLGGERQASSILETQNARASDNAPTLKQIKQQAKACVEVLTHGTIKELGELLARGWGLKETLAPGISTPQIKEAISRAEQAYAYGWKVLGAGGSGFLLVCHSPKEKAQIKNALSPLTEVPFKVDYRGAEAHVL